MSTTTMRRAATAGMVGGALWALLPAVFSIHPGPEHGGTVEVIASVLATWLFAVLPPVLMLLALHGTRPSVAPSRLRTAAVAVCTAGFAAVVLGLGTEAVTLTFAGVENDLGHAVFLVGELVLIVGELLLGIAVLRSRRDALSRAAATAFVLALPLGAGLAFLLQAVAPGTDAGFWAAFTVPTGIGWLLLGRSLSTGRALRSPASASAA